MSTKMVLQCLKMRPRVRSFASAISHSANIIGSYNHPSKCDQEITPKFLSSAEHKKKLFVGYETTSKLFFSIDLSRSLY